MPTETYNILDFSDLSEFNTLHNGSSSEVKRLIIEGDVVGITLEGFIGGLEIISLKYNSKITGILNLKTTGDVIIQDIEISEIDTSDAVGNVTAIHCKILKATGSEFLSIGNLYDEAEIYDGIELHAGIDSDVVVTPPQLSQMRILLVSDSTGYGVGANPEGQAGVVGAHIDSPSQQLTRKLTTLGYPSDSHSVVGMGNNSFAESTEQYFNQTPDVSVTLNGWGKLDFISIGGDLFRDGSGGVLPFSFDNVDRLAIGLPLRTYGVISYTVDNGESVQVSQTASPNELKRIEIDLGSKGPHTVEFETVSGSNFLSYVEAWDSTSNFVVVPWGARGYSSAELNEDTRPWSPKAALAHVPFDAIIYNGGINDVRSGGSGTSQVDYEQNVTEYINAAKSVNPDAFIFLQIPNDISTGLSYVPESLTNLAVTLGATILDSRLSKDMIDFATADAAGLMYDSLHPNNLGYSNEYDQFAPIIISTMVQDGGTGASLSNYSPLSLSYSSANFSDITLANTDTLSFWVKGFVQDAGDFTNKYILGSSGNAYVYTRVVDGRTRVYDDNGSFKSVYLPQLIDGGEHFVKIVIGANSTSFYVDDNLIGTANGSMSDMTFNCVNARDNTGTSSNTEGTIYGTTLGTQASWTMQSESDDTFDGVDWVGTNDLVYLNAPATITSADTIETNILEDI